MLIGGCMIIGGDAPENSMKAFERAVENNFGIELDVQLSKDNVPVIFHDFTLERVCGKKGEGAGLFLRGIKGIFLIWNGGKNSEDGGLPQNGKWQGAFDCGVESGVDGCVCMSCGRQAAAGL